MKLLKILYIKTIVLIITVTLVGCEEKYDKRDFYITQEHEAAIIESNKILKPEYDKIKNVYAKLITPEGIEYDRIAHLPSHIDEDICDLTIYKVIVNEKIYYLYNIWSKDGLSGTSTNGNRVEIHGDYILEKQESRLINREETLKLLVERRELQISIAQKRIEFLRKKFPNLSNEKIEKIDNHVF